MAAGAPPTDPVIADPVIVGVGQVANHDDQRIVHPVELLEAASRAALADAGIRPDQVGAVYATPLSIFTSDDAGRLVGARLGLPTGMRRESGYSGAAPLRLLAEACRSVADGTIAAALVIGGIADASVRRARTLGIDPPAPPTSMWSQGSGGVRDARLRAPSFEGFTAEGAAGAGLPAHFFALIESSLGAGLDPAVHRARLGALLAPFTEAAARRPDVAWFPTVRSAAEIADASVDNRLVAEPYTKRMCSFPTVDLAAAVVVSAGGLAAPSVRARAVRPLALTAAKDPHPPSARPTIHRSGALDRAVAAALARAVAEPADVALFDLYSCFPAAVQMAAAAFGLTDDDPRPRTVTGGLPYFGGPGASYSLHGLVCMVEEIRARPGDLGAVVGLGGMANDFGVAILAGADDGPSAPGRPFGRPFGVGGAVEAVEPLDLGVVDDDPVPLRASVSGRVVGVVDAMTVVHDRDGGPTGAPVVARLPDGARVGARAADASLVAAVTGTTLVGREVRLEASGETVVWSPT
jgi:acetyl-CoA C-acetyltransferase